MSSGNFNASYSRRPAAPAPPSLSLLGEPPISRNPNRGQQSQYSSNSSYGTSGNESSTMFRQDKKKAAVEEFENLMEEFSDYRGSESKSNSVRRNANKAPGGSSAGLHQGPRPLFDTDFGGSGEAYEGYGYDSPSRWSNTPASPPRKQDYNRDIESTGRGRSPTWNFNSSSQRDFDDRSSGISNRNNTGQFNQQNFGQNSGQQFQLQTQNQGHQGQGLNVGLNALAQMGVGQQQANQSLLNLNPGLMGMMPMNPAQNAFNLLQQQAAAAAANPMQLLLGNLPAFNSDALGKQILNAAAAAATGGGGTPFGQGPFGQQMPPPLMGIRTQDKRNFDRNSSNRSRASHRSPNSFRRNDTNRSRDFGRGSDQRVDRKRTADRFDNSDHKRSRGSDDKGRVSRNNTSSPGGGRGGNTRDGNRAGRRSDSNKGDKGKQEKATGKPKEESKEKEKSKEISQEEKEPKTEDVNEKETEAAIDEVKAVEKSEPVEKNANDDKDESKKERKKSKYDEFPHSLMVCKVCQKSMLDGQSFESHMHGRAHLSLLDLLKERFNKRADLLMAESRLAEQEVGIELERQKRAGKGGGGSGNKGKNHCKMCDCTYKMSWGAHKAGIHHRILKEFLHPTCRICDAQFVHRMDWVHHIYSTTHFKKLAELKESGIDVEAHECTRQDELFELSIEIGQDEHTSNCITVRNLDWKVPLKEDLKELLKEDLDFPEGEIIIPEKHDENVSVGEEAIVTTIGYCCKVCKIYMTQEKEVEPHLRSKSHFAMFTAYLRKVTRLKNQLENEEKLKAENASKDGHVSQEASDPNVKVIVIQPIKIKDKDLKDEVEDEGEGENSKNNVEEIEQKMEINSEEKFTLEDGEDDEIKENVIKSESYEKQDVDMENVEKSSADEIGSINVDNENNLEGSEEIVELEQELSKPSDPSAPADQDVSVKIEEPEIPEQKTEAVATEPPAQQKVGFGSTITSAATPAAKSARGRGRAAASAYTRPIQTAIRGGGGPGTPGGGFNRGVTRSYARRGTTRGRGGR